MLDEQLQPLAVFPQGNFGLLARHALALGADSVGEIPGQLGQQLHLLGIEGVGLGCIDVERTEAAGRLEHQGQGHGGVVTAREGRIAP